MGWIFGSAPFSFCVAAMGGVAIAEAVGLSCLIFTAPRGASVASGAHIMPASNASVDLPENEMFVAMMMIAALQSVSDENGQAKAPVTEKERVICRRTAVTGSLVQKRRECRTESEWNQLANQARQDGQLMRENNTGASRSN